MKIFKIILNLIRWFIGMTFILASFGGIISKEYTAAIIFLLIGLLCLPPITNLLFNKDAVSPGGLLGFLQSLNLDSSGKMINSLNFNDKENLISIINHQISTNKKPVNDKKKYNIGKQVYQKALQNSLTDLHISEYEKQHLEDIVSNFKLNPSDVSNIKKTLSEKTIQSLIQKSYDDKVLTEEEKNEIFILSEYLNIPKDKVESLRLKIASSLLKTALNEKLSDKKLSPKEETELNGILNDLQIDNRQISSIIPKKSLDELAFAKLLWSLDNGIFYSIPNAPITLRKSEECYLGFSSKLMERKIIHKGYSHTSQGVSIPIMKGVRYRVGSGRSVPIKEEVTIKHPGNIFLTNLRIVFSSGSKSFEIPFSKLLTLNVYSDGIEFILNNKNFLLQMNNKEVELFAVGMSSAIRNFVDSDNENLIKAMKEIETNEKFITS
ncbi:MULTISPECIES: hypothetical protein [Flavobacterium]|uniref:hypothetical protein n=1 Tax=Flavobacterium TaxID=237 RepID=UPI001FCA81A6|nr:MULTISPECIES: hypothetical protein [Flavobacterium]UOK43654.1 hypothetical protein LZF87_05925 [Flavobacterium enshiense]